MSASMEVMPPGGHETYAKSIFSKIKTYLDSNPYGYVSKTGDTMTGNLTAPKFIGNLQGTADYAASMAEANLTWGGKNFANSNGCIDAALMDELGANRFQFIKADAITVEYSRDNGETWTDYGATDAQKQQIFAQGGGLVIGKADSTHKATEHPGEYQLRITIDTGVAHIYSYLHKFVVYVSTNRSSGCLCKIQKALQSTPTTFVDHTDWITVSGWSGYNVLNTSYLVTYGNSASGQYGRVRFIFKDTESTGTSYNGLVIHQIKAFGGVGWNTPSTMAKTGHLYSYNENQTAVFPNTVYATAFYENNVALSSKYFALSGGTITGTPKFAATSISEFSENVPYILGIEAFANGGAVKWKASSKVTVGSATTASKLGSSNVGSATQPIYLNGGTATACTYTLGKSVPSDAVFTDTKNTAGSTDTSSKIYLIGATSQAANPQTYSQDTAYVGTDGCLYSGGTKVLTAHQDISGKADKSATVSTVTWSNNKLTKTINGTTSDVVSAATILGNLTSSQVTTALGYTPASVNTTYDFESSDNSISLNSSAVGSVVTVDMTVEGKVSTDGDTISGDYVNTADFSESGVYGKRVTTYGPWGIDVEEYLADSLWSRLSLRDSDILLTKTWDGTNTSLKSSITSLRNDKVNRSGDTMTGQLKGKNPATNWIRARDNACFINPNFANNGSYYPVISTKSKSGTWSIGVLSNEEQLRFCWESDSDYNSRTNTAMSVILRATAGTIALTSEIPTKTSQLTNDSGFVTTDTKNTAGSTDTSSKIFLIGATSQAANPQTYSQDTAYVGTDGCLYSGGSKVLTAHQDISGKADKSATVSTVTWSNNKLTKTINGTTSDVVSASDILDNLTSSQVTTALGYVPGPSYSFESSDDSINISSSMVPGEETINLKLNSVSWNNISGKPSTFAPSTHYHTQINDRGNVTAEAGANRPAVAGLSMVRAYNNGYPATYGNVITLNGTGCGEIFIGWSGSSGQHAPCYVRSKRDTSDASWSGWSKIFTASYPPTAVECGALPTTGGTVTGATTFSATGNAVTINSNLYCKSIVKTSYISRPDTGDSGYINHVNPDNNAYRPTRASAFTTMSCKYTKTNIVDISEEDALKLLDIRPVNFDYIEEVGGQKNQIGVLAEDTYEVLPKVVSVPDDYVEEDFDISKGIHQPLPSVDYAKFVPYLIKLVQMQQKEIDILKKERT